MLSPRTAAANALLRLERDDGYADAVLGDTLKDASLSRQDAALVSRIFYGVTQQRLYLDYYIALYSSVRLKKMHPRVRQILRVGAYQILFCERIPPSAAVSEAVRSAAETGNASAKGLVNAVLRRIAEAKDALPPIEAASREELLSIKYSHPAALVRLLQSAVGEAAIEALLAADNEAPPACLRVNRLRAEPKAVAERLGAQRDMLLPYCLYMPSGNPASAEGYEEGLFSVQDKASQLAAAALAPKPGEKIADLCAAPGGKSLASAEAMGNTGSIISCDIYENKLAEIERNADRLGITTVKTALQNAAEYRPDWANAFDRVLTDVPCSGLGIIRKKPDIRYKNLEDIEKLPELQLSILTNASKYVKPGGTLLYSTCTLNPLENEGVVKRFLESSGKYEPQPFFGELPEAYRAAAGLLTLRPDIHGTDGFFTALMRRTKE